MTDYIDRKTALSFPFANEQYDHENANEDFILGCETYKEWLENLSFVDVQKVVRCKDCKYLSKPRILDTGYTYFRCEHWMCAFKDTNGYCAWGRKIDKEDGK